LRVEGYAAPQLHTHAVVFNVTERENGQTRALQERSLFQSQQYAIGVYRSELAMRLHGLGYEIERGKHGQPEIKGYTQEYRKRVVLCGADRVYRVDWFRDDVFMSEATRAGGLSLASPRRRRSAEERRLIVKETLEAGSSVARVAMKHGVNANQVFKWRRLHEAGRLGPRGTREVRLLPVRLAEEQEAPRP